MRLSTNIKPRTDGTVSVVVPGEDGARYVFLTGDSGVPECNVSHEAHIAWLRETGHFFPMISLVDSTVEDPPSPHVAVKQKIRGGKHGSSR